MAISSGRPDRISTASSPSRVRIRLESRIGISASAPPKCSRVELAVQALEPVQQDEISRPGTLAALGSRRGRRVLLDRKRQELALRHSAQRPRHPGIEEPDDGLKHPVGGESIAPVNPEDALG